MKHNCLKSTVRIYTGKSVEDCTVKKSVPHLSTGRILVQAILNYSVHKRTSQTIYESIVSKFYSISTETQYKLVKLDHSGSV